MKKAAKNLVARILGWQVRRLRRKNNFKIVAVTGSIGKTSTKLAIARVLSQSFKVQYQDGNYNDLVTVPLIFFGRELPSLFNPFSWLSVFLRNEVAIRKTYPYEVVVIELGTDAPGQISQFKKYLKADIAVVTALTPEHMEFFENMAAVAKEELSVSEFADRILINSDLSPEKFIDEIMVKLTYGLKAPSTYRIVDLKFTGDVASFSFLKNDDELLTAKREHIMEPQLYSACAAAAVADQLGMDAQAIVKGLDSIRPVSGRMNRLSGINGSIIIDDTYNASPEATKAALDTLYRLKASHKIAVLGNMNELGEYSSQAHKEVGSYCDPNQLDLVVTIGPDANKHLAPGAEAKGCYVESFESPYAAGKFLRPQIMNDTLILAKGSQDRVFAEETVKILLADPADSIKLVRQSPYWLKKKKISFARVK